MTGLEPVASSLQVISNFHPARERAKVRGSGIRALPLSYIPHDTVMINDYPAIVKLFAIHHRKVIVGQIGH